MYVRTAARDEARREAEPNVGAEPYRTGFRRDAARLVHSSAFRRLQGKTQLFPGLESDFFRSRLTHSLEVGQIAKSIAIRLNATEPGLRGREIDPDLCEFAGWAHDLGHPPFGHEGETALHGCVADAGGFEGNAHSLRLLARLSKRKMPPADPTGFSDSGRDERVGLNLTARTLASILKYDRRIPQRTAADHPKKGYYGTESEVVRWIKEKVVGDANHPHFKTVECQIMDLADDIAYSTYDLEDAFHAGFLDPAKLASAPFDVLARVAARVEREIGEAFNTADVLEVLREIFYDAEEKRFAQASEYDRFRLMTAASAEFTINGAVRTQLTSQLVGGFIQAVRFTVDLKRPALSKVVLEPETRRRVEVLKRLSYEMLIESPRLRSVRYRAREIVRVLYDTIAADPYLMPADWFALAERVPGRAKPRVIADFVACMTDRYAVEFYGRLRSKSPQTIFKPL